MSANVFPFSVATGRRGRTDARGACDDCVRGACETRCDVNPCEWNVCVLKLSNSSNVTATSSRTNPQFAQSLRLVSYVKLSGHPHLGNALAFGFHFSDGARGAAA